MPPKLLGVFPFEVTAKKVLPFFLSDFFEALAVESDEKGLVAHVLSDGRKFKFDETRGIATGFLFGFANLNEELVPGDASPRLKLMEAFPVGFEFTLTHGFFFAATWKATGEEVEFSLAR